MLSDYTIRMINIPGIVIILLNPTLLGYSIYFRLDKRLKYYVSTIFIISFIFILLSFRYQDIQTYYGGPVCAGGFHTIMFAPYLLISLLPTLNRFKRKTFSIPINLVIFIVGFILSLYFTTQTWIS